jgi:hypothetical protein
MTWLKPLGVSPGGRWPTTAGLAIGASVLVAMAALTIVVSGGQAHATAHPTGGATIQSADPTTPRVPIAIPPVTPSRIRRRGPMASNGSPTPPHAPRTSGPQPHNHPIRRPHHTAHPDRHPEDDRNAIRRRRPLSPRRIHESQDWLRRWCAVRCPHRGDVAR